MVLKGRHTIPIPNIDLPTWLFGSPSRTLSTKPIILSSEEPEKLSLSQHEYRSLAKRLAKGLVAKGLKPQDKVLLFSGNNIFFPVVFMATVMAEGVFTGANPTFTPRELAYQLKDSGAKFCLIAPGSLAVTVEAVDSLGMGRDKVFIFDDDVTGASAQTPEAKAAKIGGHWTSILAKEDDFKWKTFTTREECNTTASINYSSGTTGVPKGVEITHRNFIANAEQVLFVHNNIPSPDDDMQVWIAALPMYHAYGQTFFVLQAPKLEVPVYIMRKFDFLDFLKAIEKYKVTSISGVPPIMVALAKHPAAAVADLSSVRTAGSGAAPLSAEVGLQVEKRLKGVNVKQGWGMTETTCSIMGFERDQEDRTGSVGELNPNCEAKIMADDGVTELGPNEQGELWVRGPNIMKGYYNKPEATADTVTPDGWLKTGDIGYYNEKNLFYVVDRKKELIKVKGNQVAPAELEACLLEHPGIADAGVIGIPFADDERPRAYIVKHPDSTVTTEEVLKYMSKMVSNHKQITGGVVWVDAIPKNPSGKILRKVLRDRAKLEVVDTGDRKAKL